MRRLLPLLPFALLVGCGSGAPPSPLSVGVAQGDGGVGPADGSVVQGDVRVVEGALVAPATGAAAVDHHTRIALVWRVGYDRYNIAYDVPVTPGFPAKFRLELDTPAPREAMYTKDSPTVAYDSQGNPIPYPQQAWPYPDDFGIAEGVIVAYEDLNGNGKLDLVDRGASAYIDRIVGANEAMRVMYIEGTIPGQFFDGAVDGYNLDKLPQCGFNPGDPPCPDTTSGYKPIATPYDMQLTADPRWQRVMCGRPDVQGGWFSSQAPAPGTLDCGWPSGQR